MMTELVTAPAAGALVAAEPTLTFCYHDHATSSDRGWHQYKYKLPYWLSWVTA